MTSQLHEELDTIAPQKIYLGYSTDPYQPCEAEYRQTRKVLELFLEKGFSAGILTKSDLVVRDLDLLKDMGNASVSVSVAFTDNSVRQQFEARTRDTEARIEALQTLRAAGVKTSALICPVIPYITDVTALIEMVAPHTDVIWIYGLSMRERTGRNWQNVRNILHTHFPDVKAQIDTIVFSHEHAYWTQLRQALLELQQERALNLNIHV
jgi:DNA repair photolyase